MSLRSAGLIIAMGWDGMVIMRSSRLTGIADMRECVGETRVVETLKPKYDAHTVIPDCRV